MSQIATLKRILINAKKTIKQFSFVPRDYVLQPERNYALVGVRRAGKSTLMIQQIHQLVDKGTSWDEILYINMEDERLIDMRAEHLSDLLLAHTELYQTRPKIFLDEIQNIVGWEKFVRRLADEKYHITVTGSNATMLSSEIATTLGGRVVVKEILPYSFKEYVHARGIKLNLESLFVDETVATIKAFCLEYVDAGGFPELVEEPFPQELLMSIYQKIYLGDIAKRYSVENMLALRVMIIKIIESMGQPISLTRISHIVRSTGAQISRNTVAQYIEYTKDSWLILSLQNLSAKLSERVSTPKYYLVDHGLLTLLGHDILSARLENVVALALLRRYGFEQAVWFYRSKIEIDFVVPEQSLGLQACLSLAADSTAKRELDALVSVGEFLGLQRLVVVTLEDAQDVIEHKGRKVEIFPLHVWLLESDFS